MHQGCSNFRAAVVEHRLPCSALDEQEGWEASRLLGCLDALLGAYSQIHGQGHHDPAAKSLRLLEDLATLIIQRLGNNLAGVEAPVAGEFHPVWPRWYRWDSRHVTA